MKTITIVSLHLSVGGIEKYISNLCKMLEKDYKIHIISVYKFEDIPAFEFSKKVKITYLLNEGPRNQSLKKLLSRFRVICFIKEVIRRFKVLFKANTKLKKVLKAIKTDYIITTRVKHHKMVSKYVDNKVIKVATEHNHHQGNNKYLNGLKGSLRGFNYLILPTKELFEFYSKKFALECLYIPNFLSSISNKKTNFSNNNLISVGRMSSEKGYFDLIDVFYIIHRKNKDIKLYLLGDGYLYDQLTHKVKELNLENNIIMPGFVSEIDQQKYYLDSSIYVMTSYTEAFGLVLIEAMAYGLPSVSFDTASGPKELINKETGILIEDRDYNKMALEILNLIDDKQRLKDYQRLINKNVQIYSIDNARIKWQQILK